MGIQDDRQSSLTGRLAGSDEKLELWLVNAGLDPKLPVTESYGCFSFAEAQASLFKTLRHVPVPVFLDDERQDDVGYRERVKIPIVLDHARAVWYPHDGEDNEGSPAWLFEGWVMSDRVDPYTPRRRVRISVSPLHAHCFEEDDEIFLWQYIPSHEVVPTV
ncbi:hypothetical protein ACWZJV_05395 [Nocardioides sp. WG-D5]